MKTVSRYTLLAFVAFATLLLDGCANAGSDKTVNSGAIVQLNGEDSTADRGGKIVKYLWKQKKRDKVKVSLKGNPGKKPTFIAPHVKEKTKLHFKLRTYEYYDCKHTQVVPEKLPKGKVYYAQKHQICKVNTSKDSVTITVRKSNKKVLPIAVAEVNQTEVKLGEPVSFTAENSTDENGEIISYIWSEDNETLSEDMNFTHIFETTGVHHIKLTVTDEEDQNATDTVDVEVLGDLRKPKAVITADKKIVKVTEESVRFDANESYDLDGEITSYTWKDGNKTIYDHEGSFTHYFDTSGQHTITLTVIDNDDLEDTASVTITVKDQNDTDSNATVLNGNTSSISNDDNGTAAGEQSNTTSEDNNASNEEDTESEDSNATDSNSSEILDNVNVA